MLAEIREVCDPERKSEICNSLLRALPNWFGIEEAIVDYVKKVKDMLFYSACIDDRVVGFAALARHTPHSAEICVMGILESYHRQGIGKEFVRRCEEYCLSSGREFLTVKTLDESRESRSYEKTRLFYLGAGFKPLEVFPLLWGEDNPCLFMAKYINGGK